MTESGKYDAVLFDLDGTLLDTLVDLAAAANAVLASQGFPTHPVDSYCHFVGEGAAMLFRKAMPAEARQDDRIDRCVGQFAEAYTAHWNVHTRPFPQVPGLLELLRARGTRMGVLSNKPHRFTRLCVETFLSGTGIEVALGQRETVPRKPDPAGAFEIAHTMGIPPERFLLLGDSDVDMETARRAGMFPIGALWGFRSQDELVRAGALATIAQPLDLVDWVAPEPAEDRSEPPPTA